MMGRHKTAANHIMKTSQTFISDLAAFGRLPPTLYAWADNCRRENKIPYMFAYIGSFLTVKVFRNIDVSFLAIGHIHKNIDLSFSSSSYRPFSFAGTILSDLHTL